MSDSNYLQKPSFAEALRFWCKLGWISFGGTAAHIAIMHDYLVEQKKWISNDRFLHALSHCMILPGPEATQLAIYVGWKLHGKKGGLAAGALFVLPSMFIILALGLIYVSFGQLPWISAMFNGLKPAVIALVVLALFRVASRALRGPVQVLVAAAAFSAIFFFETPLPWIMAAAIVLGGLFGLLKPSLFHHAETDKTVADERQYYINKYSQDSDPVTLKSLGVLVGIVFLVWLMPIALFYFLADDFSFWKDLSFFFTKTAFVTFGGSYTVIPYVAQISVNHFHWLSPLQMMDGFALAETTPGPLIIVLSFVGFMAGYNHFHSSMWMGAVGLLATTFYTFLPCFLFVFAGAPLVEKTHGNKVIEGILALITAVVVGTILDLTLFLGKGVLFASGEVAAKNFNVLSFVWVLVSLFLVKKYKINVIYLILLSIAFGGLRYWILS